MSSWLVSLDGTTALQKATVHVSARSQQEGLSTLTTGKEKLRKDKKKKKKVQVRSFLEGRSSLKLFRMIIISPVWKHGATEPLTDSTTSTVPLSNVTCRLLRLTAVELTGGSAGCFQNPPGRAKAVAGKTLSGNGGSSVGGQIQGGGRRQRDEELTVSCR